MPPALIGSGLSVFATDRSATGLTVVVCDPELLPGLGSASVALAVAVLVMDGTDAPDVVTTIVTVALALTAKLPIVQFMVVVPVQEPCVEAGAEASVTLAGSGSLRFTPVAGFGPLFVTVMV